MKIVLAGAGRLGREVVESRSRTRTVISPAGGLIFHLLLSHQPEATVGSKK